MKRILVIVGVVLGLGAIGLTAAHADNTGYSTRCTDGLTAGETGLPVPFVGLSYEAPPDATGPDYVAVCYSTTPNGSSSPEAAGGYFLVANPLTNDHANLICRGDRGTSQTVVVECTNQVFFTDPSAAPGTTATGSFKVGTTGPVPVGQTGAEVNPATGTNPPLGGAAGTGGSVGLGAGTCTYVNGGTPTCPSASAGSPLAARPSTRATRPSRAHTRTRAASQCRGTPVSPQPRTVSAYVSSRATPPGTP